MHRVLLFNLSIANVDWYNGFIQNLEGKNNLNDSILPCLNFQLFTLYINCMMLGGGTSPQEKS